VRLYYFVQDRSEKSFLGLLQGGSAKFIEEKSSNH
jgi:hypothetical protein